MPFDGGDLIILGILVILMFLFRQFDKNNRSLEKVRTYADKVRAQLDEIVEEKRGAIKDLSIDIDVQEKTDKEILKRVEYARQEMNKHTENIESINDKVLNYSQRVDELVNMTNSVDENLLKIKNESDYVDTVGKRISDSLRKIQLLEKAMGSLQGEFVKQNKENLLSFQDQLMKSSEERIKTVEEKAHESDQKVSDFRNAVKELELEQQRLSKEKIALFISQLEREKNQYNEILEEIAEKGMKLESEVFTELNDKINNTADKIEDNWKTGLNELKEKVSGSVEEINEKITTVEESVELIGNDSNKKISQIHNAFDEQANEIKTLADSSVSEVKTYISDIDVEMEERINSIAIKIDQSDSLLEERSASLFARMNENSVRVESLNDNTINETNTKLERFHDDLGKQFTVISQNIESVEDQVNSKIDSIALKIDNNGQTINTMVDQAIVKTNTSIESYENQMELKFSELKEKLFASEGQVNDKIVQIQETVVVHRNEVESLNQNTLDSTKELLDSYEKQLEDRFTNINHLIQIAESGADDKAEEIKRSIVLVGEDTKTLIDNVNVRTNELIDEHEREASLRLNVITGRFSDHEDLMEKRATEILDRCKVLISEHEQDSSSLLDKMRNNMNEVTKFSQEIESHMSHFKSEIERETEILEEQLNSISQTMSVSIDAKALELETGLIKSVEDKVGEYEKSVSRRFDKMDGFMEDLDTLEDNLKVSLNEAVSSVKNDFELFNDSLLEERTVFKQSLGDDSDSIRLEMDKLETGLDALKSQAYENVSEKLQLFEDDFFTDLKKRGSLMESSLLEWQKNVDFKMDEIELKGTRDRDEMQEFCTADMKVKLTELQANTYSNFDDFKGQIQDFKDNMDSSISSTKNGIKDFNVGIREEINGLKENSAVYFEEQFTGFKSSISERFTKADKAIDLKFDEVVSDFEISKKELGSLMERNEADLGAWKLKLEQEMKNGEISISDQVLTFKTDIVDNISILRDEFKNQREDLIVSTNEERTSLKREIIENSNNLIELKKDLERNSSQALDKFQSDYDDFIIDFQRKTHEFQSDSEIHVKEIRQGLSDSREKVELMQKKLFSRIEDDYRQITNNLKDIELKQQDFISQTKIFDRADALKDNLSADIETLQYQITQIEKSTIEAFQIKDEFSQIHNVHDDIQSKFAKVLSEKQKIDTMDDRINKIINLSDSVNLKLDEISSTHDTLQDYQVRLRQIEDLQDSVEKRFTRLEKKNNLMEATTDGVDKNFQMMATIEKAISSVKSEVAPILQNMSQIKEQNSEFEKEHEKIKAVIEKLSTLDKSIGELDERIEAMNKAREWVASTEARIDGIGKKAREQVQLFGKLMEKDGKSNERIRKQTVGSPDMEVREMVLRLAHEGWKSEEIARTTKLSQGEVELILELSPNFNRK